MAIRRIPLLLCGGVLLIYLAGCAGLKNGSCCKKRVGCHLALSLKPYRFFLKRHTSAVLRPLQRHLTGADYLFPLKN